MSIRRFWLFNLPIYTNSGSIENRSRFLLDVVPAVAEVWGGDRIGIKLSPSNTFYGMQDSNPLETFSYVIQALNSFGLAYLHLMEPNEIDLATREVLNPVITEFRSIYANQLVERGNPKSNLWNLHLQRSKVGRMSTKRLQLNTALNSPQPQTFYAPDATGYTDYPFLST